MKVIFNRLATLKPRTGVGHYAHHLSDALSSVDPACEMHPYPPPWLANRLGGAESPARPTAGRPAWIARQAKPLARRAVEAHFALVCGRYDLYHEPNFLPLSTRVPTVVTVHDLSVLRHPEWHPADRVALHRKLFRRQLPKARAVIVVSETVRQELLAELPLDPARVVTVHNGLDPSFATPQDADDLERVRSRHGLPARFFLAVGTIEPRKNLTVVMRAFARLTEAERRECPLILVGPWGWRAEAEQKEFHTTAAPAGVRHLGYVAAADLPGITALSDALVYPSFYEGFGLPPLESLAQGKRVLASENCQAVKEVCGRYAEYLDPHAPDAWHDAMRRQIARPHVPDAAARRAHAATFTWQRAAAATWQVYRQAAA